MPATSAGRTSVVKMSEEGHEKKRNLTHRGFLRHVVSVRGAIAGMCLIVILATGAATGLFAQETCDDALSRTRDYNDRSLATYFKASQESLGEIVSQLLLYSSGATEIAVHGFFDDAYKEMTRINMLVTVIHKTTNKSGDWCHSLSPEIWHQVNTAFASDTQNMGVGVTCGNRGASITISDIGGVLYAVKTFTDSDRLEAGPAAPVTGALIPSDDYPDLKVDNGTPNTRAMGLAGKPGVLGYGEMRWLSLESYYYGTLASLVLRLQDPADSQNILSLRILVSFTTVQRFLKNIAETTENQTGADTRIYTCIRSSWIVDRMVASGTFTHDEIQPHRQTGKLSGVSRGWGMEEVLVDDPYSHKQMMNIVPLDDVAADDAVVRGVARAIHALPGGYEDVVVLPSRTKMLTIYRPAGAGDFSTVADGIFKKKVNATHLSEPHYVTVTRVNDSASGMDWWLTVSLNAQHVLQHVEMMSRSVAETTEAERQQITDDVNSGRLRSWLFITGLAVFLIAASIVATHYVLRPIQTIQDEMANVAQMKLAKVQDTVTATSPFHEVREMQANFLKMTANLLEFRAYVPEAVLAGSLGSAPELMAASRLIAPPTGDVAVMFTDIQGSTQLWKRSAADMNTALEQHNQIIRDVYRQHDGYEVKTIGDSFMLTFQDTVAAVRVGLEIQHRFKQASWPERLRLPEAGLVVRIGINSGNVIVEENPITGRVDYRGSTVNMASRLEGKARPGTICITRSVVSVIEGAKGGFAGLPHHPQLHPTGRHELRGLGEGHELYLVAPGYLRNRYNEMCTECTPVAVTDDMRSDESSNGSVAALATTLHGGILKKTELFLQRSNGTVAVCRLNDMQGGKVFDDFNLLVRSASEAALSMDGQVAAVSSAQVTITWNASKHCRQHVASALRLAEYLESRMSSIMRLGLATGEFLHGNVGTTTQRYTTSLGSPLLVAEAAAEYALEHDFFAVYIDATSIGDALQRHDAQHVSPSLFLCDVWFCARMGLSMQVYVLNTDILQALMNEWGTDLTVRSASDTLRSPDVRAMEESVRLLRKGLGDPTRTAAVSSRLSKLMVTCRLASHHHLVLSQARPEDLSNGYLVATELTRAPARRNSAWLPTSAVPGKPPQPPAPVSPRSATEDDSGRFGWE